MNKEKYLDCASIVQTCSQENEINYTGWLQAQQRYPQNEQLGTP